MSATTGRFVTFKTTRTPAFGRMAAVLVWLAVCIPGAHAAGDKFDLRKFNDADVNGDGIIDPSERKLYKQRVSGQDISMPKRWEKTEHPGSPGRRSRRGSTDRVGKDAGAVSEQGTGHDVSGPWWRHWRESGADFNADGIVSRQEKRNWQGKRIRGHAGSDGIFGQSDVRYQQEQE